MHMVNAYIVDRIQHLHYTCFPTELFTTGKFLTIYRRLSCLTGSHRTEVDFCDAAWSPTAANTFTILIILIFIITIIILVVVVLAAVMSLYYF